MARKSGAKVHPTKKKMQSEQGLRLSFENSVLAQELVDFLTTGQDVVELQTSNCASQRGLDDATPVSQGLMVSIPTSRLLPTFQFRQASSHTTRRGPLHMRMKSELYVYQKLDGSVVTFVDRWMIG